MFIPRVTYYIGLLCKICHGLIPVISPVLEAEVWQPEQVGWNDNPPHTAVLGRVPRQVFVLPQLKQEPRQESTAPTIDARERARTGGAGVI